MRSTVTLGVVAACLAALLGRPLHADPADAIDGATVTVDAADGAHQRLIDVSHWANAPLGDLGNAYHYDCWCGCSANAVTEGGFGRHEHAADVLIGLLEAAGFNGEIGCDMVGPGLLSVHTTPKLMAVVDRYVRCIEQFICSALQVSATPFVIEPDAWSRLHAAAESESELITELDAEAAFSPAFSCVARDGTELRIGAAMARDMLLDAYVYEDPYSDTGVRPDIYHVTTVDTGEVLALRAAQSRGSITVELQGAAAWQRDVQYARVAGATVDLPTHDVIAAYGKRRVTSGQPFVVALGRSDYDTAVRGWIVQIDIANPRPACVELPTVDSGRMIVVDMLEDSWLNDAPSALLPLDLARDQRQGFGFGAANTDVEPPYLDGIGYDLGLDISTRYSEAMGAAIVTVGADTTVEHAAATLKAWLDSSDDPSLRTDLVVLSVAGAGRHAAQATAPWSAFEDWTAAGFGVAVIYDNAVRHGNLATLRANRRQYAVTSADVLNGGCATGYRSAGTEYFEGVSLDLLRTGRELRLSATFSSLSEGDRTASPLANTDDLQRMDRTVTSLMHRWAIGAAGWTRALSADPADPSRQLVIFARTSAETDDAHAE